jgi:hypothetical protein
VLVPDLEPGTVVILDNLATHKNTAAAKAMRDAGCWFLYLPPYSPDLNPCMVGPCLARGIMSFGRLVGCGHVFGVCLQRVAARHDECPPEFGSLSIERA